jgi:transcriptional regulator with XRE-family HTH domain
MKIIYTQAIEIKGLGKRILKERRRLKTEKGRSLESIAKEAGMTAKNWYMIEKEEQALPLDTLRTIERVLGIDFGVIVQGEENETN